MTSPAKPVRTVRCPQCGKNVEWTPASTYRPFCSARCRQLDLGAWASESYRVPTSPPDTEDTPPG
ncbi:DNA gyrase inhibitor YacG [Azoarcus communis]|uniref:DNA gyrase inhibitor YacG n=1 Tax=Parazoarcus communis SWub3 = DSM 12120 TaxID=1121029 RepID=A0A323UT62_9RHOO|nr:DNA gyrase inhibitor YacG [Parazoarcus communis]NMG50287.1 DNA gyrase inhibitor YacG [Parazoarcus communis]NMG71323.1 DNA gyrase inhibitor YacG [Parazoarcus communis SWub3 = DSM 12120]PZA15694.1 DNA gyrase inhibitor YacG [Azoarcus communis] [Parazoarcus communis SWub3 = DSM 12120]